MRPADLLLGGLGLTPAEDLALSDQLAHDGGDVLHRDRVRHLVLVVQLRVIGAQAGQGRIQVLPDLPAEVSA